MRNACKRAVLSALLSLINISGCATLPSSPSPGRNVLLGDRVTIGRDTVPVQHYWTVRDLLGQRLGRFSFALNTPGHGPLVVVDGRPEFDGMRWLLAMRATEVQHIDLLGTSEAAVLYGGVAAHGAIVIKTRNGQR